MGLVKSKPILRLNLQIWLLPPAKQSALVRRFMSKPGSEEEEEHEEVEVESDSRRRGQGSGGG
eukprot:3514044-Amphidinium_carterae.1